MHIATIGLDLAKNVFQIHGIDADGDAVVRRRLRRSQVFEFFAGLEPCLIGMEACGTAHFWARVLMSLGHEVKIIPPSYVKAYVRRGKNDAVDAAAICEAVTRPNMRFVPIKSEEQQAALMLHKSRALLVRQQTMLVNAMRAQMAELGMIAPQGRARIKELIAVIEDDAQDSIPALAKAALKPLVLQLRAGEAAISALDDEIKAWHLSDEASQRLASIPGVGILTATAISATMGDPAYFKSGREFAAWLGLVPRQNSSGGKDRLGRISRQGNRYIRRLLVIGATSMLRRAKDRSAPGGEWVNSLLERRPARLVTVAMANKTARIAWALLAHGETYRAPSAPAMAR